MTTRIFESAGTGLRQPTREFLAWIAAQVDEIGKHCAPDERPQLRAYRCGHEYLACDYPSLAITIRIDPDAALRVPGLLTSDIFVPDMTDALTVISLIEKARQGTDAPGMALGTYL